MMRQCKICGHTDVTKDGTCHQIVGAECLDPYGEECGCSNIFHQLDSDREDWRSHTKYGPKGSDY